MKALNKAISKFQKEVIFLALALIAMGILFISFPDSSAKIICYATGIVACLWGLVRLVAHFKIYPIEIFGSYGMVQGAALLIVGIAIIAQPDVLAQFITAVFGIIMLVDGILKIQYAIDLGRIKVNGWVWVLTTAVLMIVLGTISIVNPFETASALMIFLGCILIADGIADLVIIWYIVHSVKTLRREAAKKLRSVEDGLEEEEEADF